MAGRLKSAPSFELRWTEAAFEYLQAIVEHVSEDSPKAARALASRIQEAAQALQRHPELGRPGRCKGTRELVIPGTPYIVPYRIKGNAVEILRVMHGARKWPGKI